MLRSILFFFSFFIPLMGYPFVFQFNNTEDNKSYRIFSASLQNVQQNTGIAQAFFEQAYEAFLRPQDVDIKNNTFSLKGEYHYSQRIFRSKEAFNAMGRDKIYRSFFSRSSNGKIKVFSADDVYPSVRSVPVFPSHDVKIGEIWHDVGHEAQDFSILNYNKPFLVPFTAKYKYIQDVTMNSQDLQKLIQRYRQYRFEINEEVSSYSENKLQQDKVDINSKHIAILHVFYTVQYASENDTKQTQDMEKANGNPVEEAKGNYNGLVFWDKDEQEEMLNIGSYDFVYSWRNGEERHWSGKEYGLVTVLQKDKQIIDTLAKKAQEINKNMEVSKQKQGVKLILGDLLFHFNKTTLRSQVKSTLLKIVGLLKENPDVAIHITGHSDDIGTQDAKEKIADGRSKTVADFLVKQGIDPSRVSFSGASDRKPRVPNTSMENRKKNRRVEIDIITQ